MVKNIGAEKSFNRVSGSIEVNTHGVYDLTKIASQYLRDNFHEIDEAVRHGGHDRFQFYNAIKGNGNPSPLMFVTFNLLHSRIHSNYGEFKGFIPIEWIKSSSSDSEFSDRWARHQITGAMTIDLDDSYPAFRLFDNDYFIGQAENIEFLDYRPLGGWSSTFPILNLRNSKFNAGDGCGVRDLIEHGDAEHPEMIEFLKSIAFHIRGCPHLFSRWESEDITDKSRGDKMTEIKFIETWQDNRASKEFDATNGLALHYHYFKRCDICNGEVELKLPQHRPKKTLNKCPHCGQPSSLLKDFISACYGGDE